MMARESRSPDSVGRRRRRSSSSQSSNSNSDHRHSSSRKRKPKRSRSRSKTRSKDGSRSKNRRSSRSSSRDRRRRYYRSRSRSRGRSSNSPSASYSRSSGNKKDIRTSSDKSRHPTSELSAGINLKNMTPEEQLKSKMQMALKAAAEADAQLREKGILPNNRSSSNSTRETVAATTNGSDSLTIQEQISRAQAIDLINAPEFIPQEFTSNYSDKLASSSTDHSIPLTTKLSANPVIEKLLQNELSHENLFADKELRQEKWIRKLYTMRLRKLNGDAMS